jgi:hypothetical protein
MNPRRYAIFDDSFLGDDLFVDQGGVVLTTDAPALSAARRALSTVGRLRGEAFAEVLIYGDPDTYVGKVAVGIAQASVGTENTKVGRDSLSIGLEPVEGKIYHNNAEVATVTALSDARHVIGIYLRYTDVSAEVAFYGDGEFLHSMELSSTFDLEEPIYVAVSIGSDNVPGDISAYLQSGVEDFAYPLPQLEGWYTVIPLGDAIHIADQPSMTAPGDSPAHVRYEDGLEATGLSLDRGIHFWPFADEEESRGSAAQIVFSDKRGLLTNAIGNLLRGQPVTLRILQDASSIGYATTLGTFYIDSVAANGDLERRVIAKDALSLLDAPLQRRHFPPDAAEDVAFRAMPTTLGAVFSVEPPLYDIPNLRYMIDSLGVQAVGKVRDKGDPLNPSIPDYTIVDGGQSIELVNEPQGRVTVDASVTGTSYTPTSVVDVLDGFGSPFVGDPGVGDPPLGYDVQTNLAGGEAFVDALGRLHFPQLYNVTTTCRKLSNKLEAGKSYLLEFDLVQIQGYTITVHPATVGFSYLDSMFGAILSANTATGPGHYATVYTNTAAVDLDFYIFYQGNNVAGGTDCIIENARAVEIVEVDDTLADDEVEEDIAAMAVPLASIARSLIEERSKLPASYWDEASAEAIDYATGYTGQGFHAVSQITRREALNELLNGYTAGVYLSKDNVLTFARLVAPEDETATATITKNDMVSEMIVRPDTAPGLSRRMGVRRNEVILTDSDLVTDVSDVTMRLRRKLARRFRAIVASGAPLAPGYEHADQAAPVDTRLVVTADARAEITRVCGMYTKARAFYDLDLVGRSDLEVCQVVSVEYPLYGTVNMLITRIRDLPLEDRQKVTCWALGPGEY